MIGCDGGRLYPPVLIISYNTFRLHAERLAVNTACVCACLRICMYMYTYMYVHIYNIVRHREIGSA